MEFKLCYKSYPFKISQGACKRFFEQTGLDLQTVFLTYICKFHETSDLTVGDRLVMLSNLYSRDVACKAMYHIIKEEKDGVSMAELEDASFRVSWTASDRDDDLSEPWPLVMVGVGIQINDFFTEHLNVKKLDTSAE
jgi:hypothetical protein